MTAIPAPVHGFDESELEARAARAQALMLEHGFDALLFTTPSNIRYITGFDSQFWESPTRPWFVVLPAEGKPLAVVPEIGEPEMVRQFVSEVRTWPAPQPEDDGISLLAEVLGGLSRRFARVGCELGREMSLRMPVTDFLRLRDALPGLELADGSVCMWAIRMVKSEAEIDRIRYICGMVSDAYAALVDRVHPGDTEREAARRLRMDIAARGADATPFLPGISGVGGVSQIVCGPSDRQLCAGDILFFDTGSTYDGYFCDFDRCYGVEAVDDAVHRAHEVVWDATEVGIAAAVPGATTDMVWQAMARVLESGGSCGNNVGRMGHGLGLQLTEPPSNMPGDGTVLEPGMVLTIEPGMTYAPDKMIVHEENLVIRADGPELLTKRAPRELWLLR